MTALSPLLRIGLVCDLEDPLALCRVRVRFPDRDDTESTWARLLAPGAGPDRGLLCRPELGDEVLVGFEDGDPARAVILGGLWNQSLTPPQTDDAPDSADTRVLCSRSGHRITLSDADGQEAVEISDGSQRLRVVLDGAGAALRLEASQGDISLSAGSGTVTLQAGSSLELQAPSIALKADADLTVQAGAQLTLKGALVAIN